MRKSFLRAVSRLSAEDHAALAGARPYDLRHAIAARLYAASGDIRATQTALGLQSQVTASRYAAAALDPQLAAAVARLDAVQREAKPDTPPDTNGATPKDSPA